MHAFADRDSASAAAATRIGDLLARRLDTAGTAALVVSGGSTPARCFAVLSKRVIDWKRVEILASDERWVPAGDDDSNARLVRESLLVGPASGAGFKPYFDAGATVDARCDELDNAFRSRAEAFAAALLGMGADGHFASLFPDADGIDAALDPDGQRRCIPVRTTASPHARVSLTLAALLQSDEILLLIFGDEKRAVYRAALRGDDRYPVTHLLRQQRTPVHVYWAP